MGAFACQRLVDRYRRLSSWSDCLRVLPAPSVAHQLLLSVWAPQWPPQRSAVLPNVRGVHVEWTFPKRSTMRSCLLSRV